MSTKLSAACTNTNCLKAQSSVKLFSFLFLIVFEHNYKTTWWHHRKVVFPIISLPVQKIWDHRKHFEPKMRITKNRSVCWSSNVFCCQMSQHLYFCNLYKAFQKHNFVALVCDEWNVHIWQINYVQKHELNLLHSVFFYIQIAMNSCDPFCYLGSLPEKRKAKTINQLMLWFQVMGGILSVEWIKPGFTFFGSGLLFWVPWLKHSNLHNSWEATVNW